MVMAMVIGGDGGGKTCDVLLLMDYCACARDGSRSAATDVFSCVNEKRESVCVCVCE